jgi:uncharacterized Zn finger protein (UPF0148 family)
MSIFIDKLESCLFSGVYTCSECGATMEFEDDMGDVLICPICGHSVDFDRYGFENDEDYDALFPTREDVCGYDDNEECSESYEEVYNELSDD